MAIELRARVGKDGIVVLQLPPEFEDNEVHITVESTHGAEAIADVPDEQWLWTEEELKGLFEFNPVPAEKIVTGGWEDMGITDSQAWVEEQRRIEQEQRGWQTYS